MRYQHGYLPQLQDEHRSQQPGWGCAPLLSDEWLMPGESPRLCQIRLGYLASRNALHFEIFSRRYLTV